MEIFCGLICGRHVLPTDITDYVFPTDIPQAYICDAAYMERICTDFLDGRPGTATVNVYVTGFTPAMLALIKVCTARGIRLNAYNYDRSTKKYWRQEVL